MTIERTAHDDLKDAIRGYRWADKYNESSYKKELVARYRAVLSNTFCKIYGFMPINVYFDAIAAADSDSDANNIHWSIAAIHWPEVGAIRKDGVIYDPPSA